MPYSVRSFIIFHHLIMSHLFVLCVATLNHIKFFLYLEVVFNYILHPIGYLNLMQGGTHWTQWGLILGEVLKSI